jgi:hypothetical protein
MRRFYKEDVVDIGLTTIIATLLLVTCAFLTLMLVEVYYIYKAEPKMFACEQQQLRAKRFTFTDSVICVPIPSRRDTTTFEVIR